MAHTLLEKLNELDDGMKLKVGAVNGTSYFYCGTVGEFKARVGEYSRKGEKIYRDSAERAQTEMDNVIRDRPKIPSGFANILDKRFIDVLDEVYECATSEVRSPMQLRMVRYVAELGVWARKADAVRRRMKTSKALLGVWIPYEERKVSTWFMADATVEPEETVIVQIDGHECGEYWLISDADGKKHFSIKAIGTSEGEGDAE